ncbi:MAG: hypothetical protein IBJ07_20695 [Rhizobiaceae bacterium]|nr:hypothetical protein [Rhizobiaceae bacterium]
MTDLNTNAPSPTIPGLRESTLALIMKPATLSECDLWHEFAIHGFPVYCAYTGKPLAVEMPIDLLIDPGIYGTIEGMGEQFANDIGSAAGPSNRLDEIIEDLGAYIQNLRLVSAAFNDLCTRREINKEDGVVPAEYTLRDREEHGSTDFLSNITAAEDSDDF